MLNQKISTNLQGFPLLKSPNLDIKGQYECVLSKYPETNAILITNTTISLLDSNSDLNLDEKKFNWLLNCSGFALRIDDFILSQSSSQVQNSIFNTALELYFKWITKNPISHLLTEDKIEEYIQLFLIHISQIFLNPSFTLIFSKFIKSMNEIFIDSHPIHSEETWATLIKVLLCGSCDYAISTKKKNFTELSLLAFDILIESTFTNESFLKQFDSLLHKLFSFPSFARDVWLQIFDKVYKPIVESYFNSIIPLKPRKRSTKNSNSSQLMKNDATTEIESNNQPEQKTEKFQQMKKKYHLIFKFIRQKINQEFSKECKQEAFSRAISCWCKVSKKVKFPVHPKWPTDEIKSLFLNWFSIDCEWTSPPFHPLFILIMRGETEKTPELQKIAKNLIVNVLEKTTIDQETALFWYLPVYAYDFLMNNLYFLDSLELSFQNFAVRFESSEMTSNFDIYQHLLFILIRLVQRTKSDDIRNTMTNLAVSSEYKNNMMLMIFSILSMVVIRRGDLFWSQINKCFSKRYSSFFYSPMTKESFSKIILIAGFVPLLLRNDFSSNINIDPNFWDLLELALSKNNNFNETNYNYENSHFGKIINTSSSSSSSSSSHSYLKSIFPTNNTDYNQQQQFQQINQNSDLLNNDIKSQKLFHTNTNQNINYKAQSDDFLKSIEQQKILLGIFCLSQGTDIFTSHPENNSRLLNLLSKPKISQPETLLHNSYSYQNISMNNPSSFAKINANINDTTTAATPSATTMAGGSLTTSNNHNLLNTITTMGANAINSISLNIQSSILNNVNNFNSNSNANIFPPNFNSSLIQQPSSISNFNNDENDDFENEDVSELKIFRKMTQLSILCGGEAYRLDTLNNDMCGYTENFVTKKLILSVIGQSHIIIRHGLGINVFHIEDLGGRDCYKSGISATDEKILFSLNDTKYETKKSDTSKETQKSNAQNETKKISTAKEPTENENEQDNDNINDLYISPFDDEENDGGLLESFKELDSMFNNNESDNESDTDTDNLRFVKPPEKKDVSDAHSMLCDLGFISADSSMNTRHISSGCFGFLEKLDRTPPSSSVEIFVFQLLDDNDRIILNRNRNRGSSQGQNLTQNSPYQKKSQYSSLAYCLTNRGKRTKNLEELMNYLNEANDCSIATINYHMPTFDDEIEDMSENNENENTKNENTKNENTKNENTKNENTKNENTKNENTKNEDTKNENTKNEDTKNENTKNESIESSNTESNKNSSTENESTDNESTKNINTQTNTENNNIESTKNTQTNTENNNIESTKNTQTNTDDQVSDNDSLNGKKKSRSRRRGTIHSISPSQANQISFLLLLNETGMVIDPTSKELNSFECVIAVTPQVSSDETDKEGQNEEDKNYIVDLIAGESSFYSTKNLKSRRFYITRQNIGWVVSLAAFLFYATPGQTTERGYTHMRSPSHFTSGYCARSRQIRELFNRSESGRNTILVGCLSCGLKQSQ